MHEDTDHSADNTVATTSGIITTTWSPDLSVARCDWLLRLLFPEGLDQQSST